ncbi:hypothetical protein [Corynebacterium kalidii]|uniref:Uncharacterized protein n=1 Tax=Corynebacterium kalidii TaxID=2931982 RepID=A0A9X1WHI7_9CORY|nr:hypothetical protein [Corynebacterium kalidii]MCJ7859264.1 hypothetical protein [Corynebacterium kalidii]
MATPTFRSGPITFRVKENVKKFRLVAVDADGAAHAGASGPVYGAVVSDAHVPSEPQPNSLYIGNPPVVSVFIGPATVPLEVDGDADGISQGTPIYAAADGKVSTSGALLVGVAARDGGSGRVKTTLITPAVATAGGGAEGE